MMRAIFLGILLAFAGCGKKSGDSSIYEGGYKDGASKYAGLAFATVDAKYTASALTFNDFGIGLQRPLSTGESGDPYLKWLGDKLYLFNRSATSLNFRTLDPRATLVTLSAQVATASAGDPHDALLLDAGRLLLAGYNAGKLVVIHPVTGAVVQTVDAAWDLGAGAKSQLRPEALLSRDMGDGTKEIYVLHQGNDQDFKADGSQAVFVLKDDGKTLTPVDLDATKDKVQGIPMPVKAPARFFPGGAADQALVYGECTTFDDATCKQGFVQVDLAKRTATLTWDTSAGGLKGNGGIVKGAGTAFYALMAKPDKSKVIEKLETNGQTKADVYTFKGESGCCALYFDDSSNTLYAGDQTNLEVFQGAAGTPTAVTLDGLAYSGAFVPK